MPNWCSNLLEVEFPAEQFENIKNALFSKIETNNALYLDYNLVVPMPDEIKNSDDETWCDWRRENWGVKWNTSTDLIYVLDFGMNSIRIEWDSPWTVPVAWFKALCAKFPDLDFQLSYLALYENMAGRYVSDGTGDCYRDIILEDDISQFAADVFDYYDEDE